MVIALPPLAASASAIRWVKQRTQTTRFLPTGLGTGLKLPISRLEPLREIGSFNAPLPWISFTAATQHGFRQNRAHIPDREL
ncbi:MAG: hypothetical protein E5X67_32095 [Mesorhizobium sp.]|uniref:hypothetical protein n=1 Tax=Mesorhizobium sp. TaxID=1871066 RepID=UPI00121BCE72|nr:hypothetical protein [Mesorhizobium sp.]TIP23721.1 MAG: hypothetical protein E5X67_32095 [Mesorhizobium sp.]